MAKRLPFSEQINYHSKKVNLPTETYADIYGEEHDNAFVVAGANRNDIIADFRKAVDKAITAGTTLEQFRADFDNIVAKYGWDYNGGRDWRSRVIYDTNLFSSYQAGRYEQHQRLKQLRPYWEYKHQDGVKNPRPLHQSWDGLILHSDNPWWQTHYPINAYGCHCTVISHSASSLKRRGLSVSDTPQVEYETRVVGVRSGNPRFVNVPQGIDPGFERIPGQNRADMPSKLLFDKATAVPPKLAAKMVGNVLATPAVKRLLDAEIASMVDTVFEEKLARGVSKSVGVIPAAVIEALEAKGIAPETAVITLRDTDILHALRDGKNSGLPLAFWHNLASYLISPEAVLLDTTQRDAALLYVVDLGKSKGKAVLKMDYLVKVKNTETGKKERIKVNILRSGKTFVWSEAMAQGFSQYERLFGEIK